MEANDIEDKELYRRYLNGQKEAFEEIVMKYKDKLIYFISKYTNNIYVAEDISQDVFVYILLNKDKYDFKYSLKTYLYIIAKCRAINYLKKESRLIRMDNQEQLYKDSKNLEDEILDKVIDNRIKDNIKKLKPNYQTVLELNLIEGFKYKEIAIILNKNIGEIKILLHRAKKKLKKLLEEEGIRYEE